MYLALFASLLSIINGSSPSETNVKRCSKAEADLLKDMSKGTLVEANLFKHTKKYSDGCLVCILRIAECVSEAGGEEQTKKALKEGKCAEKVESCGLKSTTGLYTGGN